MSSKKRKAVDARGLWRQARLLGCKSKEERRRKRREQAEGGVGEIEEEKDGVGKVERSGKKGK